jgi:hypothetical protein
MLLAHGGERDGDEEEGSRKVDSPIHFSFSRFINHVAMHPHLKSAPCFPTNMR